MNTVNVAEVNAVWELQFSKGMLSASGEELSLSPNAKSVAAISQILMSVVISK